MSSRDTGLILPGDPRFQATLTGALPPVEANADRIFVQRPGSLLLEAVSQAEAEDFVFGGEYDDRLSEMEDEDEWNPDTFLISQDL